MPAFNGNQSVPYTDLRLGESLTLFNAESPANAVNSVVIARGANVGAYPGITFDAQTGTPYTDINFYTFYWANVVSSTSITIQGSNFPPTATAPQNGTTLATMTVTQPLTLIAQR